MPKDLFGRDKIRDEPKKEKKTPKAASQTKPAKRQIRKTEEPPTPHTDIQVEASVLAACYFYPEQNLEVIMNILEPRDFYEETHQVVFSAMRRMHQQSQGPSIDVIMLGDEIKNNDAEKLRLFPGRDPWNVIDEIARNPSGSFAEAETRARIVRDLAIKRRELSFSSNCMNALNNGNMTVAEFRDMCQEHFESTPESSQSLATDQIVVSTAEDIMAIESERKYILEPWLFQRSLNLIFGWRGVGKSFVSTGIAVAASTGKGFLGWKPPEDYEPMKTLFIDGEMTIDDLKSRVQKNYSACRASINGNLQVINPDTQKNNSIPNMATGRGQKLIETVIEDHEFQIVVMDNISSLFQGLDENDANDWEVIQKWLVKLRAKGLTVIIIHHAGKGGAQRGTSRREDVMDTCIQLARPKKLESMDRVQDGAHFEVNFTKKRAAPGRAVVPFEAKLSSSHLGLAEWHLENVKDAVHREAKEMIQAGYKNSEIREQLHIRPATIGKLRKEIEGDT